MALTRRQLETLLLPVGTLVVLLVIWFIVTATSNGANLTDVDLNGADLTDASLTGATLAGLEL